MPVEFSRTTARKRIQLSSGYVDVPVITQISFIDPVRRGQEYQFTVDNSANGDRRVHIEQVNEAGIETNSIEVERIDEWRTLDPVARGQETHHQFDNFTKNNAPPPYFITHDQTHIVRYRGKTNGDIASDDIWIESEVIDRFIIVDGVERGQETQFILNNPDPNSDDAQANPDDPEISDTANGVDPPWRTDPFQNLVKTSASEGYIVVDIDIGWSYNRLEVNVPPPGECSGFSNHPTHDACGLQIPGTTNSRQPNLYLKLRLGGFNVANSDTTNLPTSGYTAVTIDPLSVNDVVPVFSRCNKTQGSPLDPPDAARYPNFSKQLQFSINAWGMVAGEDILQNCNQAGDISVFFRFIVAVEEFAQVNYNLTGATITIGDTSQKTYEIIGTQNTVPHFINSESPPPYNTYVKVGTVENTTVPAAFGYFVTQDQPWFSSVFGWCDMRPTYVIPFHDYPEESNGPLGSPYRFQYVHRVRCLFKQVEVTA